MTISVFKQIFSADQLEADVTAFLQKWFRTYAAEVSEQRGHGRDRYETPKYWTTTAVLTPDAISQVRYPAVLVVSSGLSSQPAKRSNAYEAPYSLGVTILATGTSEANAGAMAKRYGAAIRTAIVQNGGLETDYIEETAWVDERFTDYLGSEQETVGSATEIFTITVKDVSHWKAGPSVPDPLPEGPDDPYEPLPTVRDPESDPPYIPVQVEPIPGGS